jgi:hypothetical protein
MSLLQDYLRTLRKKLAEADCSQQYPELQGISATVAKNRTALLTVYADHVPTEGQELLRTMRQHFAPYHGMSKSGGPAYLVNQGHPAVEALAMANLVTLEVGRHGSHDLKLTTLGFQVSQFV